MQEYPVATSMVSMLKMHHPAVDGWHRSSLDLQLCQGNRYRPLIQLHVSLSEIVLRKVETNTHTRNQYGSSGHFVSAQLRYKTQNFTIRAKNRHMNCNLLEINVDYICTWQVSADLFQ